jgi:hypothetical protein
MLCRSRPGKLWRAAIIPAARIGKARAVCCGGDREGKDDLRKGLMRERAEGSSAGSGIPHHDAPTQNVQATPQIVNGEL